MKFLVIARDVRNAAANRASVRPRHMEHVKTLGDKLLLAGPLLEDEMSDSAIGSVMIIEAESAAEVERLIAEDPYSQAGVWGRAQILPWNPLIGRWLPK